MASIVASIAEIFLCSSMLGTGTVYSEAFARYIQCSEAVSKFGLLGKHPTTNAPIASPFVQMALSFQKQANLLWYEIFDVVKQNSTTAYEGSPQDDAMEKLLRARSKHR